MSALPRCRPEEVGIPSEAIERMLDAGQGIELHSVMILRHGQVAAEGWWAPYRAETPQLLYSLSKSFTATAVGFALAERRLSLDDPVAAFFPDDLPPAPSPHLRALKVRHLLTMSVGHALDDRSDLLAEPSGNWPRAFLARPFRYAPGKRFLYSSSATYMLSAIVHRLTGERLIEYLTPRLFRPLGIEPGTWDTDPQGVNVGGWGLRLRTEDVARFGLLYLQNGQWEGRQILPPGWVEHATAKQIDTRQNLTPDWKQGYGFKFWRCQHGAYRADGAFGQFCVIHPELDLVVAITARADEMQEVLDPLWEHLLPALRSSPLPPSPAADRLSHRLANLTLTGPVGSLEPPAKDILGRLYRGGEREIVLSEDTLTLRAPEGIETLPIGRGNWKLGQTNLDFAQREDRHLGFLDRSRYLYAPRPVSGKSCEHRPHLLFHGKPPFHANGPPR